MLMVFLNEKIEVTKDAIVWTDWTGRKRATIPISSLCAGAIKSRLSMGPTSGRSSGSAELFTVQTPSGLARFTSRLKDYESLRDQLFEICDGIPRETSDTVKDSTVEQLVCRYRGKAGAIFVALFGSVFAIVPVAAFISQGGHMTMTINHGPPQDAPPAFLLPFVLAGLTLIGLASWGFQRIHNESIVIDHGNLTWTDYKGVVRVDIPLAHIVPGSFERRSGNNGMQKYQVNTSAGVVKWDGQIDNCSELCAVLENATKPPSDS